MTVKDPYTYRTRSTADRHTSTESGKPNIPGGWEEIDSVTFDKLNLKVRENGVRKIQSSHDAFGSAV